MPRDIRHVPPGSVLEITTRCVGEQKLMVPTPEVTDAILGVLGLALLLFPGIELHSFIFLSNHYHLLLTVHDPETLSRFMCFLNGNIARKVSWLIGHRGPFWSRRYADIPVVDEQAQLDRLFYLYENGVKEGLVASPADWTGPTAARALAFGEPIVGTWVDATAIAEFKKANRKAKVNVEDFTYEIPINLTPLPCLRSKSVEEQRSICLGMLEQVRAKYAFQQPMGIEAVLKQDRFEAPANPKRSREPKCHASDEKVWLIHVRAHEARVELYRMQSVKIRSGEIPPCDRPADTHPPPMHWDPRRNTRSRPVLDARARLIEPAWRKNRLVSSVRALFATPAAASTSADAPEERRVGGTETILAGLRILELGWNLRLADAPSSGRRSRGARRIGGGLARVSARTFRELGWNHLWELGWNHLWEPPLGTTFGNHLWNHLWDH